jgi:hypothetical protein
MPQVDLIDETFVAAAPPLVAAACGDPALWRRLWPDLAAEVFADRGTEGLRFTVTGPWVGTAELWLEPSGDGVIVHHYLRLDRAGGAPCPPGRALREAGRRARHAKRVLWVEKDRIEAGRPPGTPARA